MLKSKKNFQFKSLKARFNAYSNTTSPNTKHALKKNSKIFSNHFQDFHVLV